MQIKCLACPAGLLEPFSGDYGSGVYHPDGTEERLFEEGWACDRCGRKFTDDELDEKYSPQELSDEDLTLLVVLHQK